LDYVFSLTSIKKYRKRGCLHNLFFYINFIPHCVAKKKKNTYFWR